MLLDWALSKWRKPDEGASASESGKSHPIDAAADSQPSPNWRASSSQPSGIAQSHESLRAAMLGLARMPGVDRIALLRANGSLFCGRCDGSKEEFAAAIQQIAVATRRASRRMGLGAIEAIVLESEDGAIVVVAGHSICGVQSAGGAAPANVVEAARALAGADGAQSSSQPGVS